MKKYKIIDKQEPHSRVVDDIMTENDIKGFAFELIKDKVENAEPDNEWVNEDLVPIVEKGENSLTFEQAKYWLEEWWEYGVEEMN